MNGDLGAFTFVRRPVVHVRVCRRQGAQSEPEPATCFSFSIRECYQLTGTILRDISALKRIKHRVIAICNRDRWRQNGSAEVDNMTTSSAISRATLLAVYRKRIAKLLVLLTNTRLSYQPHG
jgi:hypothetical protein